MISPEKATMFRNRLSKVFRHLSKQAGRQQISCYRVYDHDLPEFPICIEKYEDWLYVAEYRRNHHMEEEEHEQWLDECRVIISDIIGIPVSRLFYAPANAKQIARTSIKSWMMNRPT
jgi:23S rRNA (cytosine1962-C5)-methyltransferase